MSYSRGRPGLARMPRGSLGNVDNDERRRFGRVWDLVCYPGTEIMNLLYPLKAYNAEWNLPSSASPNDFKYEKNPIRGLQILWIRMGKRDAWWPSHPDRFNFGPTTYQDQCPGGHRSYIGDKPSNTIRIDSEFHASLRERAAAARPTAGTPFPPVLWQKHSEGYVRLREDDPLLAAVKNNLVNAGFLAATDPISSKDNSAFVRALYEYWVELARLDQAAARTMTQWPQGMNFGPNTAHNELRVSPEFLDYVLNASDPRARAVRERGAAVLRTIRIKPPLFGGLPPIRPGGRELSTPVTRQQLQVHLSPAAQQVVQSGQHVQGSVLPGGVVLPTFQLKGLLK